MSTDILKALPPWKQALLEKKRRHEEDEKRRMADEEDRLSKMPAWKRDILIKKRQLKNSLVFTGSAQGSDNVDIDREAGHTELDTGMYSGLSPRAVSGEAEELNHFDSHSEEDSMTGDTPDSHIESGPSEEHIIPIQQNPWLRTELRLKKKHGKMGRPQENDISPSHAVDNSLYHTSCGETDVASGTRHERLDDQENNGDEVFNGEEVEYGRGFVHKLLRKFTHMSAKDEERSVTLKRSNSSENILEEIRGRSISPSSRSRSVSGGRVDHARSLSPASPAKARSMENISSHAPNLDGGHLDQYNSLHIGDGHHKLRPVSMGHEVSNHLRHVQEHEDYHDDSDFGSHSVDDVLHSETLRKSHSADNILDDERPRPNTVSAARSLFESASSSSLSARYTDTLSKKRNSPRSPRSGNVGSPEGSLSPQERKLSAESTSPSGTLQNGTGVVNKLGSVNHVHDKFGGKSVNDRTLQNIRAAGKSWTFGENSGQGPEGTTTANDRNSNYTHSESNRTSPSAAANNRTSIAPSPAYSPQSHSDAQDDTNHSINHSSNQNNNIYSNSITNGPQNEIIETSPDGKILSPTKKRTTPDVSSVHRGGDKRQGAPLSVEETNEKNRNDLLRGERLHLNLSGNDPSSSVPNKPKHHEEPQGYRDLYFSSSKRRVSPGYTAHHGPASSTSPRREEGSNVDSTKIVDSAPSYRDLYASKTSPSDLRPSKPHEEESGRAPSPKEEIAREGNAPSPPELSHVGATKQQPSPTHSKPEPKPQSHQHIQQKPIPKPTLNLSQAKPRQNNYVSTISVTEDSNEGGYVSTVDAAEPKRPVETRRTTPVPPLDLSEVTRDRDAGKIIRDKKVKRPAPSGPGKLLIRPASNLIPAGGAQYLDLTKYDDIKASQMEPAKKRASYFPDDDIPVTNIDEFLGEDVPVTNIDDFAYSPQGSPRMEQDADDLRRELSRRYEFLGAGVKLSKNLLEKTRAIKLRISFNDSSTSTYEYPSEQSLLETIPPEPGDFDYPNNDLNHLSDDAEDIIDLSQPGGSLKSTPGMGSGGGLASYKSKFVVDYQFGMEVSREEEPVPAPRRPEPEPTPEDLQITPADEEEINTWSDNTTSDMLF